MLLHSELGLGDTLLFCRYAREVAALGARVVLEVQPPLKELLSGLEGVAAIVERGAPLPAFDYHCPLMSLPLAFKTELGSVPAIIPYIRSDPARVAHWKARLGAADKPRVGIVWSGSTALKNDKRSMTLVEMLPLLRPWAEWVSLQKELREDDRALLEARPEIRHFGSELNDFSDTAALVDLMDARGDHRHQRREPRRRDGQDDVDPAALQSPRLALAARARGQRLVSDRAADSPAEGR